MIYNKSNEEFVYQGQTYYIGQQIVGTDMSEYEGFFGVITEIRDGEDKETENETPDVYCTFDLPNMPFDIKRIEAIFSDLYGKPKKIDDIILDSIIMAPDMIEPLEPLYPKQTVYVVMEDWAHDYERGTECIVTTSMKEAQKQMRLMLKNELENGFIKDYLDSESYIVESNETSYEVYEDGFADAEHYMVYIKEYKMAVEPVFLERVSSMYREERYEEDYLDYIRQMLTDRTISKKQYDDLLGSQASGEEIDRAISKNDTYWSAYWQTMADIAQKRLNGNGG